MADATYSTGGAYRDRDGNLKVPTGKELDVESGGSLKIAGTAVTATAAELNALDGITPTVAELNALDLSAVQAVVPTATGATTGTILGNGMFTFCTVASAGANDIVILPAPVPGRQVVLQGNATGYEIRSSAPSTVAICGGSGATAESAVAASLTTVLLCTSATTWIGWHYAADGTLSALAAAA